MALVKPLILRSNRRAQLGATADTLQMKVITFTVSFPALLSSSASYSVSLPYAAPVGTELLCTVRGTSTRWFFARAVVTAVVGSTSTVALDVLTNSGSLLFAESVTVKVYAAIS